MPNTPECAAANSNRVNHTIGNDDFKLISGDQLKKNLNSYVKKSKSKSSVVVTLSSSSLNTAMVVEDDNDKLSIATTSRLNLKAGETSLNESVASRLLDMAFNEDDIEDDEEEEDEELSSQSASIATTTTATTATSNLSMHSLSSALKKPVRKLSRSFSLSNLPLVSDLAEKQANFINANSKSDTSFESQLPKCSMASMDLNENVSTNVADINSEESAPTAAAPEEHVFKFKVPDLLEDNTEENMLQNVLRRQSLFKLKEKINGKVSKQINEIERRKLSPYRFCNSPLKQKKFKEMSRGLAVPSTSAASPHRLQMVLNKNILKEIPEEQYVIVNHRTPAPVSSVTTTTATTAAERLSTTIATSTIMSEVASPPLSVALKAVNRSHLDSPKSLIKAAANKFLYKKFNRNRNVKRLNATTQSPYSNSMLQAGADENDENQTDPKSKSFSANRSPTGKRLLSKWKFYNESVDL